MKWPWAGTAEFSKEREKNGQWRGVSTAQPHAPHRQQGQGRCEGTVGFERPRSKRAVVIAGVWPTVPTAQPVVRNECELFCGPEMNPGCPGDLKKKEFPLGC